MLKIVSVAKGVSVANEGRRGDGGFSMKGVLVAKEIFDWFI